MVLKIKLKNLIKTTAKNKFSAVSIIPPGSEFLQRILKVKYAFYALQKSTNRVPKI